MSILRHRYIDMTIWPFGTFRHIVHYCLLVIYLFR